MSERIKIVHLITTEIHNRDVLDHLLKFSKFFDKIYFTFFAAVTDVFGVNAKNLLKISIIIKDFPSTTPNW